MQILRNNDAKEATGSSPAVDASAQTEQQQGAKGQQSPAGEKVEVSLTEPDVKTKPKSFHDVAREIAEKYKTKVTDDAASKPAADKSEKGSVSKLDQTSEEIEEAKVTAAEAKPSDSEQKAPSTEANVDDTKLPFHKHPRFQQVIKERAEFEKQVKESAPLVDAGKRMQVVEKFCQEHNVPAQDYDDAVRMTALIRENPKQALATLRQYVQALEIQTGEGLPPDLQAQVDEGKLSLTHAQEMTKLRLQSHMQKQQVEQTAQQTQKQLQQQIVSSVNSWINSKVQTDPSFKPSQSGQYGKFEQVQDRLDSLMKRENPKTIDELIQLAERSYNEIHSFLERSIPKPAQRRPLSPKQSVREQDKTVDIRKPGWARQVARDAIAAR